MNSNLLLKAANKDGDIDWAKFKLENPCIEDFTDYTEVLGTQCIISTDKINTDPITKLEFNPNCFDRDWTCEYLIDIIDNLGIEELKVRAL